MIITIPYGTRLVGEVDRVPGRFHVATRCFHIWYLPLFPLSTWVISELDGEPIERLPLSLRSFAMAWLRIALVLVGHYHLATGGARLAAQHLPAGTMKWAVLAGVVLAIGGIILDLATERRVIAHGAIGLGLSLVAIPFTFLAPPHAYALPLGVGLLILAWLTLRGTRANAARAAELASTIGVSLPPPVATVHAAPRPRAPAPPAPIAPLRTEAPPPPEAAPDQPRVLR